MKSRNLKVAAQSGYKYRETPTITLKGLWGFCYNRTKSNKPSKYRACAVESYF